MPPTGPCTFGTLLRKHRINAGLTQDQLAKIASVGQPSLSDYENDRKEPTLRRAVRLAAALEVSLDVLAAPLRPRPTRRRRPELAAAS
jgi:transcriptional regulator with XRE-family HTH domain